MAKRFIDTNIFNDEWFCDLSKEGKLFFLYFITQCDHAGILRLNKKLCEFQTGIKSIDTVIIELGKSMVTVKEQLLFMPKFLSFQYPGFPNCSFKAALSAIRILEQLDINIMDSMVTVSKELPNSYGIGNGIGKGVQGVKKEKVFIPPTIEEYRNYFIENGFKLDVAERSWKGYDVAQWHKSNGEKIKNWKQTCQQVWFKEENKSKEPKPLKPTTHKDFYGEDV